MTVMTISDLHLNPNAKRAAELVLADHPGLRFTDGRRDVRMQANRMAANTIRYGMQWLNETYKNQQMVGALEDWMAENLEKTASVTQMTEGFYQVLVSELAGGLTMFPHCRGDAWDAACPTFGTGQIDERSVNQILYTIQQLPLSLGLEYFTSKEGQLRVIHAQFKAQPTVQV